MDVSTIPWLTIIIFLPAVGALVLMLMPREKEEAIKRAALVTSLLTLALTAMVWAGFDPNQDANYQFVEQHGWIPQLGIGYHLGVDGLSLLLVVLTAFLTAISILSAWTAVERRVKEFMVFLLLLDT